MPNHAGFLGSRRLALAPLLGLALGSMLVVGCEDDATTPQVEGRCKDHCVELTFFPSADGYVLSTDPDASFAEESALVINGDADAYLQFDLNTLPDDAFLADVRLNLTLSSAGPTAGELAVYYVASDAWDEDDLTFNARPSSSAEPLGTIAFPANPSSDVALTLATELLLDHVQLESYSVNKVLSLRLVSDIPLSLHAREYGPLEGQPRLEVAYDEGTVVQLTPVADSSVVSSVPDQNQGGFAEFSVDRDIARAFLRFDLSGIPAGAEVRGVTLTALAYTGFAFGGDGNVYTQLVADDTWDELGITWNNQPTADESRLGFWWLWYDGTESDRFGRNASPLLIDVVQDELDGDGLLSIRLSSPGYRTSYRSREHDVEAQRPQLEVLVR